MKICNTCFRELPLEDFHKNKLGKDGLRPDCKECNRKKSREFYKRNRDKQLAYCKQYAKDNKEEVKKYQKIYRIKNREKLNKQNKIYCASRVEAMKAIRQKNYYKTYQTSIHKRKARDIVHSRLKFGHIVRQPCYICNSKQSHAHHDDYSKPLSIVWLCKAHHDAWHRVFKADND